MPVRHLSRSLALTAGVLLAPALLGAQAAPAPKPKPAARPAPAVKAVPGATVEGITEYTLPNGLRVLLFPDQSKPTVTVNITYLTGSRFEGYGETGMAHLLEHMVFKGTPNHPDIPKELTAHGARPNGTTWTDRTNYFETMAATDENLAWALDLEADRMVHSFIAKKDLESEFTVVRNEFELGENDPFGVTLDRTLAAAFDWHNYGKSTIGARSDIENVPIERLQAFYRRYYQPDNAMLVVAGKFEPAKTLALIERKFGAIPRPARTGEMKLWPTYTRDPIQDGERAVTVRRVGDEQIVMMAWKIMPGSHQDFPATDLLSTILGQEATGRLYKALVETKKAATVGSFTFTWKEPSLLFAFARVRKEGDLAAAREAMQATIAELASRPITDEEVQRARQEQLTGIEQLLNDPERVAITLSESAAAGDWRLLFLNRDQVKKVTAADVNRVAAQYLKPANVTVGQFIPTEKPDRTEIPAAPDVAALVKDYKGSEARAEGEVFDPSPANLDRRTVRSTLKGGLQVAFLQKKTRGERVNLALTLRIGTLASLTGKRALTDLTADMLLRGTTAHTRQQIKDEFDRLKATVSIGAPQAAIVQVRVETLRANLGPVLALLGEVLRSPAFDAKEFELLKQENLAGIEAQRSEPVALAQVAFQRATSPYPKGDPRYTATFDEQVADYTAARLEDVRRLYAEQYGASAAQLAVVGDFDVKEVEQWAADRLASWTAPVKYARFPAAFTAPKGDQISIETPDKANAFFAAGQSLRLRDDDPAYAALSLGNYMLGGGFLNSRLAVRIRQKEGISYGVGSQLAAGPIDSVGTFVGFAIYAPENVKRLEAAFREEVEKVLKEGFTEEELTAAKTGWLQDREVGRAQDAQVAGTLGNYLFTGRNYTYDASLEKAVKGLTPGDVKAALAKFLDPSTFVTVKAGDFQKAAAKATTP